MNVLLVSPRLPQSFWSMPLLCRREGCKSLVPPNGLLTVAALLPRDWKLRLVDLNTRQIEEHDWNWAEIVMISAMIVQKVGMLSIIKESKRRGKTVVAGGPYPTSVLEPVLEAGADFVMQGEAENCMDRLLAALEREQPPVVITNSEKPVMTQSPVPRFDLLTFKDYVVMSFQTSRGCPFDCEFCDIVNLFGRVPRYKTPDQVIEEVETLYDLGWRKDLFICDDNFIGNKSHAKAILRELIPWQETHGKPFGFWCQASVNLGKDIELIDMMTEANVHQVFVGIESPDPDVLERAHKYQNVRNSTLDMLHSLNKNGLGIVASFIIGFDGEKKGVGDRICQFVEESAVPTIMVNALEVLPNTRLWDRMQREGRLRDGANRGLTHEGGFNFFPSRPESEIMEEFIECWEYLYEPSRYMARAYRFYLNMRPTRVALAIQRGDSEIPSVRSHKDPLRRRILALRTLLYLFWWQGVVSPHRRKFWKQYFGILEKNPSRFVKYMTALLFGHELYLYSRKMVRELYLGGQTVTACNGISKTRDNGPSVTRAIILLLIVVSLAAVGSCYVFGNGILH